MFEIEPLVMDRMAQGRAEGTTSMESATISIGHHHILAVVYGLSFVTHFALPRYVSAMPIPGAKEEWDHRERSVSPAMSQHDRMGVIRAPILSASDAIDIQPILLPYAALCPFMQ